jgi:trimethylamine corrinoid protein
MKDQDQFRAISEAVQAGDAEACAQLTRQALGAGVSPLQIIEQGLTAGIRIVGEKFGCGEMFLPELMIAMQAMKEGLKLVDPELKKLKLEQKSLGKVLMGTVKGDIHDIGKDIVSSMLELSGYQVVDLGSNVAAETFTRKIGEERPRVLGLSAMLTTTMQEQKRVVEALRESGLREQVKVVVGGAPVSQKWAGQIGADGYGANAELAVKLVKTLTGAA